MKRCSSFSVWLSVLGLLCLAVGMTACVGVKRAASSPFEQMRMTIAASTPAAPAAEVASPTPAATAVDEPVAIQPAAAAPSAPAPRKPELIPGPTPGMGAAQSTRSYTVQPGDSLPQIAQRFGVEPLALMQANAIANPEMIVTGQVLTIPRRTSDGASKKVIVDISDQRLYAYEYGELVTTFVVSTGQYDGTLRGTFSVLDKIANAYSEMWGFWMPDWMGIYHATDTVDNGIHALPVLANGQRLWGDSLGQPVTWGCVVLGPEDAQLLFDWAIVGTPVLISGLIQNPQPF